MKGFSFVWELTKRDFSERFAGSALGAIWALIWPLVNLFIYIIIFGRVMGARLPGGSNVYAYGVYVAAGLIPWTAFSQSIGRSSMVFLEKRTIIGKINLSLPSLLVFVSLAETVTFLFSMLFFLAFLLATGYPLTKHLILVPFIYYLQQVFAFGFGLLAATLTVFIRDLKEVIGILLTFWFWFTPIVYVREILPDIVKKIMVFNPAYVFIEAYQRIFVFNDAPSIRTLVAMTVLTHLMVCFAYWVFRGLERDVRDFL